MNRKSMCEKDNHSSILDTSNSKKRRRNVDLKKKMETNRKTSKSIEKPSEISINKYLLPGGHPLPVRTFMREGILLPYRVFAKNQEKDRFKQHLSIKCQENYKIISTDLRQRLYIDDPPNECHAIADVDPDFFLCVSGSHLAKYVLPFKSLKHLFNRQIRLKQEVGYRNDCILYITKNNRKEQAIYNKSIEKYKQQVKYFDQFISFDYQKSMLFLSQWDVVKSKVMMKISELENFAVEMFTIKSRIIGLDYRYGLLQKYGRFLYYLSPPSWRSKNRNFARSIEIEAKGFDFGNSSEDDTFNTIFEKLQKECSEGLVKPALYFTQPADLMKIFDGIEQQQLYHFSHIAQMAPHTKSLNQGIKYLTDVIAQDSVGIANTIKEFETVLEFCEERSSQLEAKFYKILYGMFYENVGVPDVLKFQHHLEYCYERVYNERPFNMDLYSVAKAIEQFYMDYSGKLDALSGDKINRAVKQYKECEKNKMKRAKAAARELRLFERLERALLRAHAPAAVKTPAHLQIDKYEPTPKKYSKRILVETKRQSLSEEEKEYLALFTDWTEKDDPVNYLQCLSLPENKS